ncbi:MAG: PKD domain-containing protein [Bacteroidia bacterium]|nr:PKD domain-containing protein [Bacteroidia bacterium]
MRKLFALLSLSMAQTIYYDENFNSVPPGGTPTGWSLNTSDVNSSTSPTNFWRVDAKYGLQNVWIFSVPVPDFSVPNQPVGVTGAPQSNFLYVTVQCDGFFISCTPDYPVAFLAGTSENSFARSPQISIPAGSGPVKLSFVWTGKAGGGSYGEAYFRENNGPWQLLTSRRGSSQLMNNDTSWYKDTITLNLSTRPTTVQIGFRFVTGAGGNDPSFAVDEIRVFEETTTPSSSSLDLVSATPSTVCAGSSLSVTYTAQNFPSGTTYTAQLFDGSGSVVSSASGNSPISLPIPNIIPSGTYRVRVAASTTPATYSDTATVTVVNVQSLACSALPNPAVPGSQVTLEVRGTGLPNGPFNVTVDPGDGSAPLSQNGVNSLPVSFTHTYSSAGSYTATFTVTHPASGCTGTCQATVQVGGERLTALVLRDSTLCEGDSFYVDYTSIGITFAAGNTFTVQVRDGGGNVVTSCSVNSTATSGSLGCQIPTGTPTGNYSVRIISSNPAHTSNSLPLSVRTAPLADFAPDANLRFCAGEPITFTDRSQGAVRVQWDFGDGQTSSSRNPTHTYAQAGTYTVTLVASVSATCTSRIQRQIDILPSPQASFTVTPPSLTLPDANTATFTNTSTGAVSYQWNFGNGQTSTAPNPTATYDREGEYVVTLTAISADGCQDTAQYRLKVTFAQGLIIPGAFTPNGDGINDRYSIRYTGMQNIRLSVYDRWGNLIFTQQLDTPAGSIEWDGTKNGQALPEGVYAAYVEGKSIDGRDIRRSVMITLLR